MEVIEHSQVLVVQVGVVDILVLVVPFEAVAFVVIAHRRLFNLEEHDARRDGDHDDVLVHDGKLFCA